jgi:hypothetical protein
MLLTLPELAERLSFDGSGRRRQTLKVHRLEPLDFLTLETGHCPRGSFGQTPAVSGAHQGRGLPGGIRYAGPEAGSGQSGADTLDVGKGSLA